MDRGERIEMMVDIYESSDCARNHEVMIKSERQQALQHTGSVSVKNRRHRAVHVCLWLLCVLLLTAVIVLCVYFTTDRKHLITHNYKLTKQREKLPNDIKELNRWLTEDLNCNSDKWIYYNYSFYHISIEVKTWNNSRDDCKQRGADLVIINSKEEQEFMQNATAGYGYYTFWIGLRKEEGLWKWIDETTLTTSFWITPEYPRSYSHYCARTSSSGWSDFSCDDMYGSICEKGILKSFTI